MDIRRISIINLFIFFVFLVLPTYSYESTSNVLEDIISLIIIIAVIITLLYLGGVFTGVPGVSTLPNWLPIVLYGIIVVIIFLLPILQKMGYIKLFPDDPEEFFIDEKFKGFKQQKLPSMLCNVFKNLNISESVACYLPAIIYFFILPFAAIYTIVWAFLKQLNIFEKIGKNIEALLAFIITFMTLPMGSFILLTAILFSFMGAFSIAIFAIMFLSGVFLIGYRTVGRQYGVLIDSSREKFIKRLQNEAKYALKRISEASSRDEIIKALERFLDKTNLDVDFDRLKKIEGKTELDDVKKEAEKYIRELLDRIAK